MQNTTTTQTTDEALVAGILASPDFILIESREDMEEALGGKAEDTTPAPAAGDKITYTGEIIFAESNYGYWGGRTKRSMFVIVKADDGTSYKFDSAADFAKHIGGGSAGILCRGNRVTFSATVKQVGEYKGSPSITVNRPRMIENDYAGLYGMPLDELPA